MFYLALFFVIGFMYLVGAYEEKANKKQTERLEVMHESAYEWIDEHTDNNAIARERKALVDMLIKNCVEANGRKYSPQNIKQVTTAEERKERNKAAAEGKPYYSQDLTIGVLAYAIQQELHEDDVWHYSEHSDDEKREHFIGCMMNRLGISRDEAERKADKFYAEVKGV